MNKKNISVFLVFFTLIILTYCFYPQTVSAQFGLSVGGAAAQGLSNFLGFPSFSDLINFTLAQLSQLAMSIAGLVLVVAGYFLNLSIVLTLHIKEFVDATPVIYTIWKIIRDLLGIFIIMYLLYTAILIMISQESTQSYKKYLVNIVLYGILINFSFFITSVAIDASNVVSQAIYNSIIPVKEQTTINGQSSIKNLASQANKGQISDIFMNSLKIQTLYDVKGNRLGTQIGDPIKIIMIGFIGIMMMLTTAASFMLAALAFSARLIILVFLLVFSSVWFVTYLAPQLKDKIKFDFWKILQGQLIFMPVYLLLMYVALYILNNSNIIGVAKLDSSSLSLTGANWVFPYIMLIFNFIIVIIMLNLPLVVGLSMGGYAVSLLETYMKKFNAMNVWKGTGNVARSVSGATGAYSLGQLSSWADKKLENVTIGGWAAGNSRLGRAARSITTGAVAKSKFGGEKTYADYSKEDKEIAAKSREIFRRKEVANVLSAIQSKKISSGTGLRDALKKMTGKEKLMLGAKTLKDPDVIKHLSSDDFKAIKENKDDQFRKEEVEEIMDARKKTFKDAVAAKDVDTIKNMMNEMDGKDLLKVEDTLDKSEVIKFLKISQLDTMNKEGLGQNIKDAIRNEIQSLPTGPGNPQHSALNWINKNF